MARFSSTNSGSTTSALVRTTLKADYFSKWRRGGTRRAARWSPPKSRSLKAKEKNVKDFDFCSNPFLSCAEAAFLSRGSSLWSLLASMVVPQQLSQKAFEKLATNQDLSNAIEKVSKDDDEDDYVDFFGS